MKPCQNHEKTQKKHDKPWKPSKTMKKLKTKQKKHDSCNLLPFFQSCPESFADHVFFVFFEFFHGFCKGFMVCHVFFEFFHGFGKVLWFSILFWVFSWFCKCFMVFYHIQTKLWLKFYYSPFVFSLEKAAAHSNKFVAHFQLQFLIQSH